MVQVKKAMMYSILTVMLLLMLILVAISHVQRDSLLSDLTSDSFASSHFSRMQSTIATDYLDIMGFKVEKLSSSEMKMNHTFKLSEQKPLPEFLLNEYISYFENHYGPSNNFFIELGLKNSFFIQPFSYSIERTNNTYTSNIGESIQSISLTAELSENKTYFNENETIIFFENGTTDLSIKLYDNSSTEFFYLSEGINLSGNGQFLFEFNSTEPAPSYLIEVDGGKFYQEAFNELEADVSLIYEFINPGSKIYLNTGIPTRLESTQKDFSKEEPITLMTG